MDCNTAPAGAASAAATAAGDGSGLSSSIGLAGLQIVTDRGPSQARHQHQLAASAINQLHLAGVAVSPALSPPAAAAAVPAVDELTALLHQLEVQATGWTPQRLLSWFQPASDAASAAMGALEPSEISSIQTALLQQDVKDKFGRNVLHTVASWKPGRSVSPCYRCCRPPQVVWCCNSLPTSNAGAICLWAASNQPGYLCALQQFFGAVIDVVHIGSFQSYSSHATLCIHWNGCLGL